MTLDLNAFELRGAANTGNGIYIPDLRGDIVVKNGVIRGWGGNGIAAAATVRSRFHDLIVSLNGSHGLNVGQGSVVERVVSSENGESGIRVAALNFYRGGLISDSRFANNGRQGVLLEASYTEVRNNTIAGNGTEAQSNAVRLFGSYNQIVGNSITSNVGSSIRIDGAYNIVAANTVVANSILLSDDIFDAGAGNRVGPIVSDAALTSSNPFANVQYNNPPP